MAVFAKYDGIDGESKDANHAAWVDVLSLDWSAYRPTGVGSAGSRRRGTAVVEDMVLSLPYEKAAPKLLEKCLEGAMIPRLEVEVTATYGGSRVTYLRYELENVLITSYQVHASGDDEAGPPTVVIANDFEKIEVTYTEFDDDGTEKAEVETEYTVDHEVSQKTTNKKSKKKGKKRS